MRRPLCVIFVLLIVMTTFYHCVFTPESTVMPDKNTFVGRAFSVTEKEGLYGQKTYSFTLKSSDGDKLLVNYRKPIEKYQNFTGKIVKVKGELKEPTQRRNPRCFDYAMYLKTKGIYFVLECDSLEFAKDNKRDFIGKVINGITLSRERFLTFIADNTDKDSSAMIKAMLFGLKDDLDEDIYEDFQRNGTAHLLATSGLHIGIIYGVLTKFPNGKRKIIPNILIILFFVAYTVMANFNISVIRAVFMIVISIVAKLRHRRYDLLSSLAFVGTVLTVANPLVIFNAGFQMSFLAVFILGRLLPRFSNLGISVVIKSSIFPVIAIQFFMTPYIAYTFNYFSLTSFAANFPVTAIGSWMLPLGLLLFGIFTVCGDIPDILISFLEDTSKALIKVNEYTYADGKGSFDVVSPPLFLILLFYLLFLIFSNEDVIVLLMRKKKKTVALLVTCSLICASTVSLFYRSDFDNADIVFVDVGQGCCMFFLGEEKTVMIDGGGRPNYDVGIKTVKPFMLKNGIDKIDVAMATHLDDDHYLGIKSLAEDDKIKKLIFSEGNRNKKTPMSKENMIYVKKGERIILEEDFYIDILAAKESQEDDENEGSIVCKVHLKGQSILVTGDIGCETEKKLKGNLKSDILQVPHHGSGHSSSDELIKKTMPQVAVFQVGKNNYGHPAPDIIEKYKKFGIITVRNDLNGAIGFTIDKNNLVMHKMTESRE